MKALLNLVLAALVVPVFLLAPDPAQPQAPASAESIEQAVILAHSRAREAGGRPGPLRIGS